MQGTQKINLSPFAIKDMRAFVKVFLCSMFLLVLMIVVVFIFEHSLFELDYLFLSISPPLVALVLMLALVLTYIVYPQFSKVPIPASIECNLDSKRIIIYNRNAKLFSPLVISLDKISEITYRYDREAKSYIFVDFSFKMKEGGDFLLRSYDSNSSHIKFIATLEAIKEQEEFETKLVNFSERFFFWINRYQTEGKLSLFLEMGY